MCEKVREGARQNGPRAYLSLQYTSPSHFLGAVCTLTSIGKHNIVPVASHDGCDGHLTHLKKASRASIYRFFCLSVYLSMRSDRQRESPHLHNQHIRGGTKGSMGMHALIRGANPDLHTVVLFKLRVKSMSCISSHGICPKLPHRQGHAPAFKTPFFGQMTTCRLHTPIDRLSVKFKLILPRTNASLTLTYAPPAQHAADPPF